MSTNKKYKDSLFVTIFKEPAKMLELYNALSGNNFPPDTPIEPATLEDVLFMDRVNDLAFVLADRLVVLIESQSTVNYNMPLRLLIYIGRVYEKILDNSAMYRSRLMKIPKPEFYVLYNGLDKFDDMKTLRLSDAFKELPGMTNRAGGLLELEVTVINVNSGHNPEIIQKSESLSGYSEFVAKVREYQAAGHSLDEAAELAVKYCISHGIMQEFLLKISSEVLNMLTAEFDMQLAKKIWEEEAREEGREEGWAYGRAEGRAEEKLGIARNLKGLGLPVGQIMSATGLDESTINQL
ncbi:MAG: hypothetical protein LBC56_04525 [Oscillospiraceae bacterium]|jgi:predicted transposase/invertase (TIGR01784 family)|nr:hypothetical protein [Oscillospiraceae bacterium]